MIKAELKEDVERKAQIDTILDTNWSKFSAWVDDSGPLQTLEIPEEHSGVFIPGRILELAENPSQINAFFRKVQPDSMSVIVYERFSEPISSHIEYGKWLEEINEKRRNGQMAFVSPSRQEDAPEGIDYKHVPYSPLIESGALTLNDKVYFEYLAKVIKGYPQTAVTVNFFDRSEMHGMGIGRSFYDRLEEVLKKLGFEYLGGQVISGHAQFFEKDRSRYSDLPEDLREKLPEEFADVVDNGGDKIEYMVKRF